MLRAVIRVGILWVMSVAVAIAGMEAAHRLVLAVEREASSSLRQPPSGALLSSSR